MEVIKRDGYKYGFNPQACSTCGGHCCTGESGYIWVKRKEIEEISDFLDISVEKFAIMYLKRVKHRYTLLEYKREEKNDFACIFFDDQIKGCSIYPVRPLQCRIFPFWDHFKNNREEVEKECPGIV